MSLDTPLPGAMATDADLLAHLQALIRAVPELAPLAAAAGDLPLRRIEPDYAGLVWVIVGQQISVAAARAILARLEAALGSITIRAVLDASDEVLRGAGLSVQKQRTLRAAALALEAGLDLAALKRLQAEDAIAALTALRGVGRWTAEVYLLFALGHPDIFPAGDLALQEAARLAFDLDGRPTQKQLLMRADAWRPHRAVAARLLWAYYRVAKSGRDGTPV